MSAGLQPWPSPVKAQGVVGQRLIRFPFQDNKISAVIPREVAESMRRSMKMRRMDCSDYASLRAE